MTADATLSAALRALSSDIAESGDSEACALLERAAKRIDEQHEEILHLRIYAPRPAPGARRQDDTEDRADRLAVLRP